ncbi:hypothetical protein P4637_06815 [Halalkalibacterium halodurans]|jgi:membrane protein YdbS with pleckstrin-like domain|uniref:BH0735 protein n=2 Tax=Halalkalibacterium halodurans TaxID=86665 RepID=Q9KEW4_HALH5|nr:hypothetical protein [Halalkalibacterium halodurans]MDY7221240.1 hypothetical protein [Halalkalibacterium halodurans]MDY7240479.1 hypothetical protein [Halalkalibacterium halodurans]MED4080361.1 hypothetical protein [Halalkalibacterium halodurans]MED4084575.1 hypothetical protein [Halalkalibacterium halodurans]MED4104861.1 hypothetical protein [Halalkalibacterium halodurans]
METEVQTTTAQSTVHVAEETAPVMKVSEWLITMLLLVIPIVNLIMVCIWAFGGNANPNKENYSKAFLIMMAIVVGLYVILLIFFFMFAALLSY